MGILRGIQMRCAVYARVSSSEQSAKQDAANQIEELRREVSRLRWNLIEPLYVDHVSGTKGRDKRPELDRLFTDATRRKFDVVLVWSTDRLTREGPYAALGYVKRLSEYGVCFKSYQQPFLDTCGSFGEVLLAIFGWMAEEERKLISQRTKTALARQKARGVKLGRRPVSIDSALVETMRARGESLRAIAKAAGASVGTIHSLLCSTKGEKTEQPKLAVSASVEANSCVQHSDVW